MAALAIAAEQTEARVTLGQPASIRLHVSGWPGTEAPIVRAVPEQDASPYPWVAADVIPGTGAATVHFDPTTGPRPRPGRYPVLVSVEAGGERVATVVRFVVERHPCLRVGPTPSVSFDPFTMTATVKVQLWSCGNVDLDVSWSARLKGHRIQVDPATVKVSADGGPVDTTVSFTVPIRTLDVHTDLDLEALSEAGTRPVHRSTSRRHVLRDLVTAVGVAAIAAIALGTVRAIATATHRDQTVIVGAGTTAAPSTAEPATTPTVTTTDTAAPTTANATVPETTTTVPSTTRGTPPPPPPHVVSEGSRRREIRVLVGDTGQAEFDIANEGGQAADVAITPPDTHGPFRLVSSDCDGRLASGEHCQIGVSFSAAAAGNYVTPIVVRDRSTGETFDLTVVGEAGTVDLIPRVGPSPLRATGCPDNAQECFAFTVFNAGTWTSPATSATVNGGRTSASTDVPPIAPSASVDLVVAVGGLCSTDCSALVTVDPAESVRESDETNNVADWFVVG